MDASDFQEILDDLFSLEVNTVLKPNLTATKMPTVPHALIDIANDYDDALVRLDPISDDERPEEERYERGVASLGTFDAIRRRASRRAREIRELGGEDRHADLQMLCRIKDNADQLKPIFEGKNLAFNRAEANRMGESAVPLTRAQQVMLRKIWEISTEEILAQTIIYLDGDVITRIKSELVAPPDPKQPDKRAALPIHGESVNVSISFWGKLVGIVAEFVKVSRDK